jgi:hypothetical protein
VPACDLAAGVQPYPFPFPQFSRIQNLTECR